jgi:GAF domain-containing protein
MALLNLARTSAWVEPEALSRDILPVDPPRAHASGPAPYRVLAVGGRLLAGHGVLSHDLALTGALARGLSRLVGHGVDVESVIIEQATVLAVDRALRGQDVSNVDAIVLVLDHGDDVASSSETSGRVHHLMQALLRRLPPAVSVTLVVAPATAAKRSWGRTAAFAAAVREGASAFGDVVHLVDRLEFEGPAKRYAIWGETIATDMAERHVDPMLPAARLDVLDEEKRIAAVRRMGPLDGELESVFGQVVSFAAHAYGTDNASFTVIEGDNAHYLATQGDVDPLMAREDTICNVVLQTYGGVIVGDAQQDPRFAHLPGVQSGAVRFYAGYRVESPDGQPLGALCVFDDNPRPVRTQDLDLLRDFAAVAERRLWAHERTAD